MSDQRSKDAPALSAGGLRPLTRESMRPWLGDAFADWATWLEHQGSDDTHRLHLSWIERAILSPHYAWHHYEHHHWPSVPYSQLPALRKIINDRQRVLTLKELLDGYKNAPPVLSGKALKAEKDIKNIAAMEMALTAYGASN